MFHSIENVSVPDPNTAPALRLDVEEDKTSEVGDDNVKKTSLSDHHKESVLDTGSRVNVKKRTIDDTFQLTRQNLTAIPAAAADGFWHVKDTVSERGQFVVHKSKELADIKTWKCMAVSGIMTCCFYVVLLGAIPVVLFILLHFLRWSQAKESTQVDTPNANPIFSP